jgi:hypothetical protein
MDIWIAMMGHEGADQSIVGVYSTEERAEAAGERVSPGDWYTSHEVLDELPDWIDELEAELSEERERLRNQPAADGDRSANTRRERTHMI